MSEHNPSDRKRIGWIVILLLAVLTGLEFWLSFSVRPVLPYLVLTAIAKAGLILYYFMHVNQLWKPGKETDDHNEGN